MAPSGKEKNKTWCLLVLARQVGSSRLAPNTFQRVLADPCPSEQGFTIRKWVFLIKSGNFSKGCFCVGSWREWVLQAGSLRAVSQFTTVHWVWWTQAPMVFKERRFGSSSFRCWSLKLGAWCGGTNALLLREKSAWGPPNCVLYHQGVGLMARLCLGLSYPLGCFLFVDPIWRGHPACF